MARESPGVPEWTPIIQRPGTIGHHIQVWHCDDDYLWYKTFYSLQDYWVVSTSGNFGSFEITKVIEEQQYFTFPQKLCLAKQQLFSPFWKTRNENRLTHHLHIGTWKTNNMWPPNLVIPVHRATIRLKHQRWILSSILASDRDNQLWLLILT